MSMNTRRFFVGLVASAGIAVAPSGAQATAVTVGDYYQEGSTRKTVEPPATVPCTNIVGCYVMFNIIPAGKQLLVTDVSCTASLSGNNADNLLTVKLLTMSTTNVQTDRATHLIPVVTKAFGTTAAVYAVNGQGKQLFKAGERPLVRFGTSSLGDFGNVECSIAGKVGNPPE